MKKHVLFWVGIKSENKHLREKHGNFKYLDISRKCWEYWCNKNDVIFFPYETSSSTDAIASTSFADVQYAYNLSFELAADDSSTNF